ncbi:MAG TPA: hypothetical protein VJJ47_00935 [Candidatus Paceibacterota bacterium]
MPNRTTLPDNATLHIYLRGARGLPIVDDDEDRWAFLDAAYRANRRDPAPLEPGALFLPGATVHPDPLVDISAFCVLDTHYHLEIETRNGTDGSKFMQRLGSSFTTRWHGKYETTGQLFEAGYRVRPVKSEGQAQIVFAYISVVNAAEAAGASREWSSSDELIAAATSYKFSSLPDYYLDRQLPLVTKKERFLEPFPNLDALRDFVALRPNELDSVASWTRA